MSKEDFAAGVVAGMFGLFFILIGVSVWQPVVFNGARVPIHTGECECPSVASLVPACPSAPSVHVEVSCAR